jgi:DNA-binding transcriptional MerR regulator
VGATKTFKLDELAAAAGVSGRTVRYYVQRGLLPAPQFRGRDTAYDEEHLLRLQAIRRMQDQYLPLDAIQAELARALAGRARAARRRPTAEADALADAAAAPVPFAGAAGDARRRPSRAGSSRRASSSSCPTARR